MTSEEYIRDFNLGYVRDIGYRSEFKSVAYDIEEDAASDELKNNREARVSRAMDRLDSVVDELFRNAGLDCLNHFAVKFITRMVAEAMIVQRDQTVEWGQMTTAYGSNASLSPDGFVKPTITTRLAGELPDPPGETAAW